MLTQKNTDKRALRLLSKYDVLAEGYKRRKSAHTQQQLNYIENYGTTIEDFNYMKEKGLAFDPVDIGHDEAVLRCIEYQQKLKKKQVTDSFIAGLSSMPVQYRSGLSAYAIMQSMPHHKYIETAAHFCEICSGKEYYQSLDLTHLNSERYIHGSLIGFKTPYEIQFFLAQQLSLPPEDPTTQDFDILNSILCTLANASEDCKPTEMQKILQKIPGFKATVDQCARILETFGFCSILETPTHKGYLNIYTNPGLAPSKSHSSNWAYPVDFWTGRDKINIKALDFWFGEYKEIQFS